MDKKYICYCGLHCENCAVKAKIEPAAKVLYEEMKRSGFAKIIHLIPGGGGFWPFLENLANEGMCVSCQEGSGNPDCAIRICAKEKGVEICALCESYPCANFDEFLKGYPGLHQDNEVLRDEGMPAWSRLQDERKAAGFTYAEWE